ncbi:DNA-directed RNA polymerase III subunit RPC5 [Linepithema humile]|uniref:DNA-directed RNA polymerase III subunit RPC5 n=1 Tax=Linepithema humile TaxID=83485 RepID=UPI0006235933|nr:PREDICTED: DNA-directed RNA polymerase III subunit RPC5 [Linepithema humile]
MNIIEMENDPVVKEIPVFLSKTLADKLFVVQYPAYTKNEHYNSNFLNTYMRSKNPEIRMELAIDTENKHFYDPNMGEELAHHANGKSMGNNDERKAFDSELMDKVVLTSERSLPDCSNFAVGVIQDDELHITPLQGMLRMKLQCDYLDESDKRTKDGAKGAGEDNDEDEDSAAPVKVTFARHLTDNLKKIQEQSFQHHSKKSQEEPWIQTNYVSAYDTQTELTRMEMFCPSAEESINSLNLAPKQYVHLLVPQLPKESYSQGVSGNQTNLHYIMTLPLLDQIRIIMKHVKVISFAKLREILLPEHDTAAVLKYLQQVAVLVQGNWVVNSELIYPKDSLSSQSGVSELMCKARDYILLSFTEQQFLKRNTISSVIKLAPEEINEIFTDLGTHEPKKGWRLKEPLNWDFCDRYPEIAQRQEMFWDAKRKHLREAMEAQNQPPQRQRRKSHRESLGSENEERNIGRGRKSLRDSSLSDDGATEPAKHKKSNRSRKVSETTT